VRDDPDEDVGGDGAGGRLVGIGRPGGACGEETGAGK
jgi:hypothetical protein